MLNIFKIIVLTGIVSCLDFFITDIPEPFRFILCFLFAYFFIKRWEE